SAFADPGSWRAWWPDLVLEAYLDRGDAGLRWTVRGALVGTMEVWLEPVLDGTVLHYFLRADFPEGPELAPAAHARRVRRELRRRQVSAKRAALTLKATLEDGRRPGVPPSV
ncbi:MAG: polyketide cyclase / dehydrase and lipid transport, partial [Sciscionella sp.]